MYPSFIMCICICFTFSRCGSCSVLSFNHHSQSRTALQLEELLKYIWQKVRHEGSTKWKCSLLLHYLGVPIHHSLAKFWVRILEALGLLPDITYSLHQYERPTRSTWLRQRLVGWLLTLGAISCGSKERKGAPLVSADSV